MTSLFQDIPSLLRLSIADAAELVREHAGHAKESLRGVDKEVQQDTLGREKRCLRAGHQGLLSFVIGAS